MNCPHCVFKFKILIANGELPRIAPILCESCGEVSILVDGAIRVMKSSEREALKGSPAWTEFILPALEIIRSRKRAKNAKNN